jgi:uncharacterized membrane protein
MTVILFISAIGSALIGGVFFAFSTFVMRALAQLPHAQGIAAMQRINVVVLNPLFLGVFVGIALLSAIAAAWALWQWQQAVALWTLLGGLAYLFGCFGVTMACNVPRNERLAKLHAESDAAAIYWRQYCAQWLFWNHVRTAFALLGAALFIVALTCLS